MLGYWRNHRDYQSNVLRIAAGFTPDNIVGIVFYYDFINRIVKIDEAARFKPKKA